MHPCSQDPSLWKMSAGAGRSPRFSMSWSQVCFHFLGLVRQWWPQITNYPLLETSKGCIQITQWVRAVLIVPPSFPSLWCPLGFPLNPSITPSLFLWSYIWGWCGYYSRDPLPSGFLGLFLFLLLLFSFWVHKMIKPENDKLIFVCCF